MKNKGKKREERKIEKDEVTKKTRERVVEKERTGKLRKGRGQGERRGG